MLAFITKIVEIPISAKIAIPKDNVPKQRIRAIPNSSLKNSFKNEPFRHQEKNIKYKGSHHQPIIIQ